MSLGIEVYHVSRFEPAPVAGSCPARFGVPAGQPEISPAQRAGFRIPIGIRPGGTAEPRASFPRPFRTKFSFHRSPGTLSPANFRRPSGTLF